MRTIKNITALLVGIAGAAWLFFKFVLKKPFDNGVASKEEVELVGHAIAANTEAIVAEQELREQIKEEMKNGMDAEVSQDDVVDFINHRKS